MSLYQIWSSQKNSKKRQFTIKTGVNKFLVCVPLPYKIPISFKIFSEAKKDLGPINIQYHAVWTAHNMILISYILSRLPVCISHCTSDFNISFSGGGNEMNIWDTKFVKIFDCQISLLVLIFANGAGSSLSVMIRISPITNIGTIQRI